MKGQREWDRGVKEVVELSRVIGVRLLRSRHMNNDVREVRELVMRIFFGKGLLAELQRPRGRNMACHVEEQGGQRG